MIWILVAVLVALSVLLLLLALWWWRQRSHKLDQRVPNPLPLDPRLASIDHLIVLMMENRSYDHYFGARSLLEGLPGNGLQPGLSNPDLSGTAVAPYQLAEYETRDPPHNWAPSHHQFNGGANDGFLREFQHRYGATHQEAMGFYARADLAVSYELADHYVSCDQWYASALGPTWPNRFYLHAASSNGERAIEPEFRLFTIWDQLRDAGIPAWNYFADVPWSWAALGEFDQTRHLVDFFDDAQRGDLPAFAVIDPPFLSASDHAPQDPRLGQIFINTIYQALARSPQWERLLFLVTYDEHGGFFDHVPPPNSAADPRPAFTQLGFRVPTLAIGPYVGAGLVQSDPFDHVSILATLANRFQIDALNARTLATPHLASLIDPTLLGAPRPPAPIASVPYSYEAARQGAGMKTMEREILDAVEIVEHRIPEALDFRHRGPEALEIVLEHAQRLQAAHRTDGGS